jgi:hypothetical protein
MYYTLAGIDTQCPLICVTDSASVINLVALELGACVSYFVVVSMYHMCYPGQANPPSKQLYSQPCNKSAEGHYTLAGLHAYGTV